MNGTLGERTLTTAAIFREALAVTDVDAQRNCVIEFSAIADIADKAEALADALLCVDVTFGGRKADVDRARLAFDAWLAIERAPRIGRE